MTLLQRAAMAAMALLALTACQRDDAGGKAPLAVAGALFEFNHRYAVATYIVTLSRNGPLPDESYIETRYEDPRGGEPISEKIRIYPFWDKVALRSAPVHCIVKDRPYKITMQITDASGTVLQDLETTVTSDLDQSVMSAKPLVVGAGYERNPEVFGADGKADYSPEAGCPAG